MAWVDDIGIVTVRRIGALEIAGAPGLILPMIFDVLAFLTPLAAVGLALIMVGAMVVHAQRGEVPNVVVNVVLLAMALFVAYGRFVTVPA